jgi:Zn-dependent protease
MSPLVWNLLVLALLWLFLWGAFRRPAVPQPPPPQPLARGDYPAAVDEALTVTGAELRDNHLLVRGRLRLPAAEAMAGLEAALAGRLAPTLQAAGEDEVLLVLSPSGKEPPPPPVRAWLHWLLLVLTLITTTWAGAQHHGGGSWDDPATWLAGVPYSLGLMLILGVHELGHYFAARRHGMAVTPPFFIPVPFALGTFGAFIQLRSRPASRRALFDMAVAGPLAGLVVAVPALLIGLRSSSVIAAAPEAAGTSVGSSLAFAGLAKLAFGEELQAGHLVRLSPLAFAGWLGLLVTALNLLPIGQLDGGHVARALLGHRAGSALGAVAMWSLLLLAFFVWPGLMTWALIVFFLAGRGTPPAEDVTPLSPGRRLLGLVTFAILLLLLLPLPHGLWPRAGIHCPYL